MLINPTKM